MSDAAASGEGEAAAVELATVEQALSHAEHHAITTIMTGDAGVDVQTNEDGTGNFASHSSFWVERHLDIRASHQSPQEDHPCLGVILRWVNDVHFVMLLVFLIIVDILACNFEILHAADWLKHEDHIVTVVEIAGVASLTILSIFFIEVTLRAVGNPKKFFKKRFNVIDMAVVYISVVFTKNFLKNIFGYACTRCEF